MKPGLIFESSRVAFGEVRGCVCLNEILACENVALFLLINNSETLSSLVSFSTFEVSVSSRSIRFLYVSDWQDGCLHVTDGELIFLAFSRAMIEELKLYSFPKESEDPKFGPFSFFEFPLLFDVETRLNSLLSKGSEAHANGLYFELTMMKILHFQLDRFKEGEESVNTGMMSELDCLKLERVKMLLETDITIAWSLKSLVREVGLNEFKLKKGFKELFGTTVISYLTERRMLEASNLLIDTELSVYEVASNCGYESVQSFIKAFKKKYGLPPEKYRKGNLMKH